MIVEIPGERVTDGPRRLEAEFGGLLERGDAPAKRRRERRL